MMTTRISRSGGTAMGALISIMTLLSTPAAAQSAGTEDLLDNGSLDHNESGHSGADDLGPELSGYRPHSMAAEIGMRNLAIANGGYQLYGPNGWLGQLALTVNVLPFHFGQLSLGFSTEYAVGSATDTIRGLPSAVTLHRLGAGAHAQYIVAERLRFFARVTPGAWYADARVTDAAFDDPFTADGWTWGLDTSAGVALRLGSAGGHDDDPWMRFWLMGEAGYGFAGDIDMNLRPQQDEEPQLDYGAVSLPALSPTGFTSRLAFGVSF